MALDIAGFIIVAVGVVGIVHFSVTVFAGRGRQQAFNAQLQGLAIP